MTIPLGASPTNTAFADKLDQLLVRGTLSDVQQSLHLPTSDAIRLGRQCTTSPLSLMDSSTSYGTVLLGCAALARRSFAFRLACFAIVLEAGANPFARGRDGRAVSWVLDSVKNSAERECFVEELQRAKQAWMSGEKYEIGAFPRSSWPAIVTETVQTAADIQEWIDQTLTLIEEEKREALEQSKRDALVQSPQEMKLAAAREPPETTPPPAKRPRLDSPAPETQPASQNESLPDYDEVVAGVKAEPVEPKLPSPKPAVATRDAVSPERVEEDVTQPPQASEVPSVAATSAATPTIAAPAPSRLSRLPPGFVQGPQVQPQPVSQPPASRRPPPPPPPLPLATAVPPTSSVPATSSAQTGPSSTAAAQPSQSPAPNPAPVRKSRLPSALLGRPPPAQRVQTPAPSGGLVPPVAQTKPPAPPAAASPPGATRTESASAKVSPPVPRVSPTTQQPSPAPRVASVSRLPPGLADPPKVNLLARLVSPNASSASKPPTSPAPVPTARRDAPRSNELFGHSSDFAHRETLIDWQGDFSERIGEAGEWAWSGGTSRCFAMHPKADAVLIQFSDVPTWMTGALFQHYLLHGPTTYLNAKPEEVGVLEALVECGSFVPTVGDHDDIPPIPTDVQVFRVPSGRLAGQATYSSRGEADRAKRLFDGRKVLGRAAEVPLLCLDADTLKQISGWRERAARPRRQRHQPYDAAMRVTELILDGFKSYPVRTSIAGWDPSFNAITGLNGSGKSNILDAICFVLGITNLTTVRAANLLDLIYKRGQAGVTRASVTIVFDNSDTTQSPVGFEKMPEISVTRQISVNGQSKYLICGHRSTQQAVQNLFQSVQLNINNPNFLIMQGKITKVLNMRPLEILSMIEEAAGTSMFEEKKDKAIKTMSKKEKKLDEIQSLLREEIVPKLDRLREEKRTFLEFQKTASELERLSKLVIAWDWTQDHLRVEKAKEAIKEGEARKKDAVEAKKRMEGEIKKMEQSMKEIEKARDKELAKGGKVQGLEKQLNALDMEIAKLKTQAEGKEREIKEEETRIKELEKAQKDLTAQRKAREYSSQKNAEVFAARQAELEAANKSLTQSEDLLQTIEYGKGLSKDAKSSGYDGQLAAAKELAGRLETEAQLAKHRIDSLQKELKEKEPKAKKAAAESKGLVANVENARKEKEALEQRLKASGYDEAEEARLEGERDQRAQTVELLRQRRELKRREIVRTDFRADDPYPGFDRSSVYGTIASLVELPEENAAAATALEYAAGGALYNVAVRDDATVAAFVKARTIKTRTNLLPVNSLQVYVADKSRVAAARKHGAELALNLIKFDERARRAMESVFGNVLIAPNKTIAKRCTDDPAVRMRCVTYEGDIYDTTPELRGGNSTSERVLIKVQELRKIEQELEVHRKALEELEVKLRHSKGAVDLKKALDQKAHALSLLEKSMQNSNATRVIGEVDTLRATIAELQEKIEESKAKQKEAQADVKRIEREMTELSKDKGSKVKQIKADIAKQRTQVAKLEEAVESLRSEVLTDELELDQMKKEIASAGVELAEARSQIDKIRQSLSKGQAVIEEKHAELQEVQRVIAEETKKLKGYNDELDSLKEAINGRKADIVELDLQVTQVEKEVEKAKKDAKDAADKVAKREKEFDWIADECQTFGKPNSPYNFNGTDMRNVKEKCRQLEETHRTMKRKVNPKVLSMIDSVEKKEKDLLDMYKQVMKDKTKIEETVAKLDEHKRETLEKTWKKVDGEFGNIFAELLPGNFCKLQALEGKEITQGLEVKVRLGSVWKASLTELSGGQRSLIALSLIMSLLRFKPAPMYILDEVDAALDMSHTENIGRLFRTRFKGSQFIVVSLKDGLFSNANVLFRARFRDGTSVVERTSQRTASGLYDKENAGPRAGGAGKAGKSRPGGAGRVEVAA